MITQYDHYFTFHSPIASVRNVTMTYLLKLFGIVLTAGLCVIIYLSSNELKSPIHISESLNANSNVRYHDKEFVLEQIIDPLISIPLFPFSGTPSNNNIHTDTRSQTTAVYQERVENETAHLGLILDGVYNDRRKDLAKSCLAYNTPVSLKFDPNITFKGSLVDTRSSLIYCAIPKVGSTFWARMFGILGTSTNYSSPFEITRFELPVTQFTKIRNEMNATELNSFLENAFSFLFVRDPYARLYSGYENKLYNANNMFWSSYGRRIVQNVRRTTSEESLKFGHDVTFAEFVKYIIKLYDNDESINDHFSQMHLRCDPCKTPFHIVGKLETFKQDAVYILEKFKERNPNFNVAFTDFDKETALDTATWMAKLLYHTKSQAQDLFKKYRYPFYNLILRTWCGLQIRGYLSKNITLPVSVSEAENVSQASLVEIFREALSKPVKQTAVKLQREEALIQAYRTISLVDMERLRRFVLADCQLFGYDDRPAKLFDRSLPYVTENEHLYMAGL